MDLVRSLVHAEQPAPHSEDGPCRPRRGLDGGGGEDRTLSSVGEGLLVTGHHCRSHGVDGAMESR